MKTNWKKRAQRLWAELKAKRADLVEEFINRHYLGGGGCLIPHSALVWPKFAVDDVAYETLADDCDHALTEARCRVCGCTDSDCAGCVVRTGEPCFWVEPDLCSACVRIDP